MSGSQGMHSPVAQFEITPLIELSLGECIPCDPLMSSLLPYSLGPMDP